MGQTICSKRCVSKTSHLLHLFVERCKIYGHHVRHLYTLSFSEKGLKKYVHTHSSTDWLCWDTDFACCLLVNVVYVQGLFACVFAMLFCILANLWLNGPWNNCIAFEQMISNEDQSHYFSRSHLFFAENSQCKKKKWNCLENKTEGKKEKRKEKTNSSERRRETVSNFCSFKWQKAAGATLAEKNRAHCFDRSDGTAWKNIFLWIC